VAAGSLELVAATGIEADGEAPPVQPARASASAQIVVAST
jgi:hypothetical protein